MGYICDKPKGSCKKCEHYRPDTETEKYACFAEQDAKRQRTVNEFVGMSDSELDRQVESIKHQIDMAKWVIKNRQEKILDLQKEIEGQKQNIVNLSNQLNRIKTARKHVDEIETVNIIWVTQRTVSVKKNPNSPARSYYSPTDWKDIVIYNFGVYEVNKSDYDKANVCLYSSENNYRLRVEGGYKDVGYTSKQRTLLQEDLLRAIKQYNVVDVGFNKDVSIGKAAIEKAIGHEVIVK